MIAMAALGALLGGILFALAMTVRPPKVSALVQLGRFDAAQRTHTTNGADLLGPADQGPHSNRQFTAQAGAGAAKLLLQAGIRLPIAAADLALAGKTFEQLLGQKLFGLIGGFLGGLVLVGLIPAVAGVSLSPGIAVVVAVIFGVMFFLMPDLEVKTVAKRRREQFRRTLASYLDLVSLEMAGSAAPAEALPVAARIGTGWPLLLIRDTLYIARRSGQDSWEALTQLGTRIGVTELRDLGSLVHLVANDGAKVRTTLTERAKSMRRAELAETQSAAGEKDQSMHLAQVLIGFAFIVFLGYPAVVQVLNF